MCVFKEDEMQAVVEKERGRTLASWICFYSWCKASIYCCCLWSSGRSLSSKLEQKWLQQWGMQFLFRALVSVPPGSWAASWRPPVSFGGACCCTDLHVPHLPLLPACTEGMWRAERRQVMLWVVSPWHWIAGRLQAVGAQCPAESLSCKQWWVVLGTRLSVCFCSTGLGLCV